MKTSGGVLPFCWCFLPPPFCSAHSPTGPRSTLAPGLRKENPVAKIVIDFFEKLLRGCMVGQRRCFPPYSLIVALGYRPFIF